MLRDGGETQEEAFSVRQRGRDDIRDEKVHLRNRKNRGVQFAPNGSVRPPWSSEVSIRDACNSCGDCITACPESILKAGRAGTPIVDFHAGACTFCEACATACTEDVFDLTHAPWSLNAELTSGCLLNSGVACRSCTDACNESALRFDLHGGSVGQVRVDQTACTGCGACLPMCPVGAITLTENTPIEGVAA